MRIGIPLTGILFTMLWIACTSEEGQLKKAESLIDEADIARHVSVLASDEFGGRAPASEGETKTLAYLTEAFQKLGLRPGNGDRFLQEVPLVEITADPDMELVVQGKGKTARFRYLDEFVAGTRRVQENVAVSRSELVFVGYGIVAPEYGWNDYAGIDVQGKTVVMLVNDPGYATLDSTLFTGKAMTYYGRWTYKYEEAARQGAAGGCGVGPGTGGSACGGSFAWPEAAGRAVATAVAPAGSGRATPSSTSLARRCRLISSRRCR